MFEAMEHGTLKALFVLGENPAQSEADATRTQKLLSALDCMIVQDIFLTKTAEMADVVFPASAAWCESDGTVTNSERRVQRVRKALPAPGEARDDILILCDLARRLGRDFGNPTPEDIWNELRALSPMHGGMSYARLEAMNGIQWPCPDEAHPGSTLLHERLWENPIVGPPAPFSCTHDEPPVEALDAEYPLRLTTGRRLDSYNTGVQTGAFASPLRRGETVDLHPDDARRLHIQDGETVRVTSRRGTLIAPARIDVGLRPGLVFMTFHFPGEVETNLLTIDASDPKSGTAEFKAAAIRVEKLHVSPSQSAAADSAAESRFGSPRDQDPTERRRARCHRQRPRRLDGRARRHDALAQGTESTPPDAPGLARSTDPRGLDL
jgi:formate dehydrogenase major subunit